MGILQDIFWKVFGKLLLVPVCPVFTGPSRAGVRGQQEDCHLARLSQGLALRLRWSFTPGFWRQLDADCLAGPLRTDLFPLLAPVAAQEQIARAIEREKLLAVRH